MHRCLSGSRGGRVGVRGRLRMQSRDGHWGGEMWVWQFRCHYKWISHAPFVQERLERAYARGAANESYFYNGEWFAVELGVEMKQRASLLNEEVHKSYFDRS